MFERKHSKTNGCFNIFERTHNKTIGLLTFIVKKKLFRVSMQGCNKIFRGVQHVLLPKVLDVKDILGRSGRLREKIFQVSSKTLRRIASYDQQQINEYIGTLFCYVCEYVLVTFVCIVCCYVCLMSVVIVFSLCLSLLSKRDVKQQYHCCFRLFGCARLIVVCFLCCVCCVCVSLISAPRCSYVFLSFVLHLGR